MTFKLFILIACSLAAVACACGPSPEPKPDVPALQPAPATLFSEPMEQQLTLDYRACRVDSDCVLALNGCCDCANGGEDIAVARDKARAFQARFRCTGGCTERGGDCGNGTIRCESNLCVYKASAP